MLRRYIDYLRYLSEAPLDVRRQTLPGMQHPQARLPGRMKGIYWVAHRFKTEGLTKRRTVQQAITIIEPPALSFRHGERQGQLRILDGI